MSSEDSQLKFITGLVVAGLAAMAFFTLRAHKFSGPPKNPWFQSAVISRSEPVLVKFGAEWCGPCRAMEPELDQVAGNLRGRVSVIRVDVDQHRDLARHYGISSIPHLMLFHHGQVVADRVGYADHRALEDWIASYSDK